MARLSHEDRGSMPMALLAIMVIAAVVGVVTATVIAGERQTRFDITYERSLQVAEEGIAALITRIKNETTSDCAPASETTRCLSGTLPDGSQYVARAEQDTRGDWEVVSSGNSAGVHRRARVLLQRQQPFRHAMFADRTLNFQGNTRQAYSFDSINKTWNTGNATVATNASNYNPNMARCDPSTTSTCDAVTSADIDVASDAAVAFWFEGSQGCQPLPSLANPIPPGTYCVQHLNLSGNVVLSGSAVFDPTHPTDPSLNAVKIYVTGNINVGSGASVNCSSNTGTPANNAKCQYQISSGSNFPAPGALQIYSIGQGQVSFGNSSRVSAAIFAPRSHCTSNPHAHIYGSLVCRAVGSFTGHFRLYYDEALKAIYGPEKRIWSEEPCPAGQPGCPSA